MLKGMAIFGLVMIHLVFDTSGTGDTDSSVAFEFIYCFLFMFFVVSGYFYRPERGFWNNTKKRLSQLLVAYVLCTVILTAVMYVYLVMTGYSLEPSELVNVTWRCLIGKTAFQTYGEEVPFFGVFEIGQGYYFIEIMIVAFVIFYAVADWALKDIRRSLLTMFLLATVTCAIVEVIGVKLPFYAESAPLAAALMLAGAVMGKYKIASYIENGWRTKRYWAIFIIMFVIGVVFISFFPTGLRFNTSRYGAYGGWSAYPFLVIAISCGYVLLTVSSFLSKIPLMSNLFMFLGEHTLVILLFHTFYAKLLISPFCTFDLINYTPTLAIPSGMTLAIASIILSIITGYVVVWVKRNILTRKKVNPS